VAFTGQTPIKGPSKGDPAKIKAWLRERGVGRPDDADDYIDGLYEMAPDFGINADVCVCQFLKEASRREPPHEPGHGVPWLHGLNPVGIGVTSDATWKVYNFVAGRRAAMAHLEQLSIYVNGLELPAGYRIEEPYEADPTNPPPRWHTTIAATPSRIKCATVLSDLDGMWAVPGVGYGASIATRLTQLEAAGLLSKEEPRMVKPAIVLVAGHNSVGDGGNPVERALTPKLAVAYKATFEAEGYPVTYVNPELTPGGLSGLALKTARALQSAIQGGANLVIMLDLHFNGRRSGVHSIVAHNLRSDGRGPLDSGFSQGRDPNDLSSNNTLDVRLGKAIAKEIAAIDGMTLWGSTGLMLENQTGVGNEDGKLPDNARLGMMGATAPYRMSAVRLTVEHGGTDDADKPDFFNKSARAALRAIEATLIGHIEVPEPGPTPDEDKPDVPPAGDPGVPSFEEWAFGEADGFTFDPDGEVTNLWLERGRKTGRYPRLVDTRLGEDRRFLFSDGSVVVKDPLKPAAWLEGEDSA
jgi:hypothetical protein